MRNERLSSIVAANIRFFMPNEGFFEALAPYKRKTLVDAGAGCGLVSKEAEERGFTMLAVDLMPRAEQWAKVLLMEAESLPYSEHLWLLMCRPDHSGWAYDTLEVALKRGAGVFYAGLERNFDTDLGDYVGREAKRWTNVGEDGEDLFLFMPEALLTDIDD